MNSVRRRNLLALIPGLVVGLVWIWHASWQSFGQRQFTLFDDAMISMTYGRTLSQTGELVWFPGAPRIEGFTNPLWTLYMAGIHRIGLQDAAAALIVALTGLACVLAAAYLAGKIARYLCRDSQWVITGVVLATSLSFPALFWSTRGMEVGLELLLAMVLLVNALAVLEPRADLNNAQILNHMWLAVAVLLGVWTRLDFAVLCVALIIWALFIADRGRPRTSIAITVAASLLGAVLSQTLWRLAYYGQVFPNTYYLKVEGHGVIERLLRGQWTTGKLAIVIAIGVLGFVALVRSGNKSRQRVAMLLVMLVVAIVAYSTYVGGDAWDEATFGNRYVVPVYALCSVLFITGMAQILHDRKIKVPLLLSLLAFIVLLPLAIRAYERGSIVLDLELNNASVWLVISAGFLIVVCCIIGLSYLQTGRDSGSKNWQRWFKISVVALAILSSGSLSWIGVVENGGPKVSADQRYADFGRLVQQDLPIGTTTAVVWAGAPVYYSHLPAYDLLGKSDSVIAHETPKSTFKPGHDKYDYAYSVGILKPDVIYELFMPTPELEKYLVEQSYEVRCFANPVSKQTNLRLWTRKGTDAYLVSQSCSG